MRLRICLLILAAGLTAATASAQARMELVPSVSFSTAYDDNIFTVQEGSGDAMMLVTPAFEAFYESPNTSLRGLFNFDMQRAVGYSTLNARCEASRDDQHRLSNQSAVPPVADRPL